ncbi:M48 family metalloprotease [Kitasatospora sp. NBC_01539]|uniref:M48 family metalloprotease n=1 Tax=Kitasatospora sp. NBC_01539 TaxID=2903577 RepID=UPI00386016C3
MTLALALVALTLLCPWGAVPAARRLARLLPPRAASLALTGTAVLLAGGAVAALVGLLHVPLLASLERMPVPRLAARWPVAVPVAGAAGAVLVVQAVLVALRWRGQRALLARAWASVGDRTVGGDLLVVPDADADAFALPGRHGRGGRVVVTAGMMRALGRTERDVLLAHERAHLSGRHHLLSCVTDLAAAVHPAVRDIRSELAFHLERWADESAAASVGDRRAAATAIARAALASSSSTGPARRPGLLLSVSTGPVPRRVEALMAPAPGAPRGRALRALTLGLGAVVALAVASGLGSAYGLHEYVEAVVRAAQGR